MNILNKRTDTKKRGEEGQSSEQSLFTREQKWRSSRTRYKPQGVFDITLLHVDFEKLNNFKKNSSHAIKYFFFNNIRLHSLRNFIHLRFTSAVASISKTFRDDVSTGSCGIGLCVWYIIGILRISLKRKLLVTCFHFLRSARSNDPSACKFAVEVRWGLGCESFRSGTPGWVHRKFWGRGERKKDVLGYLA